MQTWHGWLPLRHAMPECLRTRQEEKNGPKESERTTSEENMGHCNWQRLEQETRRIRNTRRTPGTKRTWDTRRTWSTRRTWDTRTKVAQTAQTDGADGADGTTRKTRLRMKILSHRFRRRWRYLSHRFRRRWRYSSHHFGHRWRFSGHRFRHRKNEDSNDALLMKVDEELARLTTPKGH